MKIGIITFWQSKDNYGQVLQCWALQKKLKDLGHNPFLIKYIPIPAHKETSSWYIKMIKIIFIVPVIKSCWKRYRSKKLQKLAKINANKNLLRKFDEFRELYIEKSSRTYIGLRDLQENPPTADAYICGSDQVWGVPINREEVTAYYLNFGSDDTKRISYAASFGMTDYPTECVNNLSFSLSKLNAISVREKEGVKICNKAGFHADVVLDPTLLLYESDYLNEFPIESPNGNKDYVFIYSLNLKYKSDIYWTSLKKFTEASNLDIIVTTAQGYWPAQELFNDVSYKYATIPEWLSLIKHSKLVVTSSFHGIVFCILFHVPFVYVPVKGKWSKGNNRVRNLLSQVGLEQLEIRSGKLYEESVNRDIDWRKIDEIIEGYKNRSYEFLTANLF